MNGSVNEEIIGSDSDYDSDEDKIIEDMIAYEREMNKIGDRGAKTFFDDLSSKLVKEFEEKHKEIPMCWPKNKWLFTRMCQIDMEESMVKMLQILSSFNPIWGKPYIFICHPKYKDVIKYSQLRFLISWLAIPNNWIWGCIIKVTDEKMKELEHERKELAGDEPEKEKQSKKEKELAGKTLVEEGVPQKEIEDEETIKNEFNVHSILLNPAIPGPEIVIMTENSSYLYNLGWDDLTKESKQALRDQVADNPWPEGYPDELKRHFQDLKALKTKHD